MKGLTKLLCAAALLAACGGKEPTYAVAGHTLTVRDSGYVTTTERYCLGAAVGQMKIQLVDYFPICGGPIAPGAPGGSRDPQLEHNELELILVTSVNDNPKVPFEVSPPNCDIGPAGPGIAYFKHYRSGSDVPETEVAQSGEIFLTSSDPAHLEPAKGSFKLDFGGASKIEGTFETFTCN
jgi:hypothetical protein